MLERKNIHKSSHQNEVLREVDIEVPKGDVVVILGPSGSGKTTLLRCMNFLERADRGNPGI
ncbi:ATP-binding cassette domain-containing protein [Lacrimispora sp. 210928-DFI.3.58]|uniref:ATP-binding cassette domain-containing protein n=1 Tax=Lacrimispora sp. 210928-DFI.3.58 TaxID=2883214 RepID=UPI002ED2D3C2